MTYTDTYLVDNSTTNKVNDGRNIYLNCTGISYSQGAFVPVPQLPGKSVTTMTHNTILAAGDWLGIDNPSFTISGVIEIIKADLNTEVSSTTVTLRLLQQILKSGHIFKLYDYWDSTIGSEKFRLHSLSGTFPNESESIIYVMVTNLTVETKPTEGTDGRIMVYTLTAREVKNE